MQIQKLDDKYEIKNNKLCFLIFFFISIQIVFSAAPCLSSEEEIGTNKPLENVTLQLKWKHQFQFAGYYAALAKGYYREAGLDVKIIEAENGVSSTDKVISGKADFGIAMSDLIQLRAQGHPVVALATIFQHSPSILLAPKKSGIENIHNFIGKKIAFEPHSEQLLAYLESEGLPAHRLIIHPHDYGIDKLVSGDVDAISAYSTDEPFLLLQKGIEYNTFSPRAGGIDFYGDTLFTTERQISDHPERVSAFMGASIKGWEYALDNTEEIIDLILSKYSTRHSREHLLYEAKMSKKLIMSDVVEVGYMNPGRWLHISNTLKKLNKIPLGFSLKGFIYDRNPKKNLGWLYLTLVIAIVIACLFFLVAKRFYKLNKSLEQEIKKRQENIQKLEVANHQINTLKDNLTEREHLFRTVADFSHDWEYWQGADEEFIYVSPSCESITGYSSEEFQRNKDILRNIIYIEDLEKWQKHKHRLTENHEAESFEFRILTKAGDVRWIDHVCRAVFGEKGEYLGIRGSNRDTTKLKLLKKEIKTLKGFLPICASCKKIRDDEGYWNKIESYIQDHSEAEFSHGICPNCAKKLYPDMFDDEGNFT